MLWRAISEELPGPKWAGLFAEYWPFYRKWWLKEGEPARPTYAECRRALKAHMPDLIPLYEDLCDQAGGGDLAARFLSFYCPPPYLSGCSQAVWGGKEPVTLDTGESRTFLEDGDRLTLTGTARGDGFTLGFGECTGRVLPALKDPYAR